MNGQAGDDGMEPTTDAVEAVQPGEEMTMAQRANKLIDELYQELDQCKENRQFLRERGEQDALLIAELKQLLVFAQALMEKYHGTMESLYGKPRTLRAPVLADIEAWQKHAKALLGDAQLGEKEG